MPRSISSVSSLIETKCGKVDKKLLLLKGRATKNVASRNKGYIIFPGKSRDMVSLNSTTVQSACNLKANPNKYN